MSRVGIVVLAGALVLFSGPSVSADWLVTRDGERVETLGPWEVKGRQVLFTLPNGTLSMMRASDVDLEASAEITSQSREAESKSAVSPATESRSASRTEQRKAVLVVTNDSLGGGEIPDEDREGEEALEEDPEAEDPAGESDTEDGEATASEPVEVVSWRSQDSASGDGIEILGTVRNTGSDIAADIRVSLQVSIPEAEEETLFTTRAFLGTSALTPGKSTSFRALLPGIYNLLEDPSFEVSSDGFSVQGLASPPSSDEDSSEDDFELEEEG